MLIQKDIEAKIIDALRGAFTAASVDGVTCAGAWATAQSGLVKWIESPKTAAFVNVSVGCPGWQTFSTPVVDMSVNISLFIRIELDPTGEKLAAVASVIEGVLKDWQTSTYQATFTALDVDNMSVDGISIGSGASPTVADGNCIVSWPLTLSGSYRESTPPTP